MKLNIIWRDGIEQTFGKVSDVSYGSGKGSMYFTGIKLNPPPIESKVISSAFTIPYYGVRWIEEEE